MALKLSSGMWLIGTLGALKRELKSPPLELWGRLWALELAFLGSRTSLTWEQERMCTTRGSWQCSELEYPRGTCGQVLSGISEAEGGVSPPLSVPWASVSRGVSSVLTKGLTAL